MAEPPWILKHGLVVIGGRDLGLPRPTVDQLVADVGQFHRDSALAVLLRLNLALTHHRPLDQAKLLREWLPDLAERLLGLMREQGATVVFHERQVLNLIRLVILFGRAGAWRRCDLLCHNPGDRLDVCRTIDTVPSGEENRSTLCPTASAGFVVRRARCLSAAESVAHPRSVQARL
jgi:hypothetical protein